VRRLLLATVALAALLGPVAAEASRDRDRYNNNDWEDRRENRRDARRADIVASVVVGGIASSAARKRAEQRYQECVYATG